VEKRPDPGELLAYVKNEELQKKKGKLKIFLGAAPGVGKTYSMLQDAIDKLIHGLEVVAGVVETHGRQETEALLTKLEVLPKKTITYREHILYEFDLDEAISRHPGLILIDEMAHENAPGSRHKKRWQDIEEILDRGIDVYTTLNIQHVESLNNIVSEITGITVRETIPDTILKRAHSIELVDLPAEDLIKRLQEGKVYVPQDINNAIENFFKPSNLTALRELALRMTAEQIDVEVLLHRKGESVEKIWPTAERLLVCVSPNEDASKLIRATFRMAENLHAEWVAVFVETPSIGLEKNQHNLVIEHLRLAEQLGGEALIVSGTDIVTEIISLARSRNMTRIILGKRPKSLWKKLFKNRLVDEIISKSEEIDIYLLKSELEKMGEKNPKITKKSIEDKMPMVEYVRGFLTISLCVLINLFSSKYLGLSSQIMVYFLGVLYVSEKGYLWPAFLTSILSVFAFHYFSGPARFGFFLDSSQYFIELFTMLLVSEVIVYLSVRAKWQVRTYQIREQRTSEMYLLSKELAHTRGINHLLEIAIPHISRVFKSEVVALIPHHNHYLVPVLGHSGNIELTQKERSVAEWVYKMGKIAGYGTETLPDSEAIYVPLIGSKGVMGVLRILPQDPEKLLIPEQLHFLEGFSNQIAMALEVDRLQDEAKKTELKIESDRVRNILLKYICSNLYSPLRDIMNSAKSLHDRQSDLDPASIKKLGGNIYSHSEDLNHLIQNLSQTVELETETIEMSKSTHSLYQVVNHVLKGLHKRLKNREVNLDLLDKIIILNFNRVFMEQVFFNIIENAIKYTPEGSPIRISTHMESHAVTISIEDEGPGLALDEINKIFEKFYRGQTIANIQGMGLGLAICQKIIVLHGGKIWAENRATGGTAFRFTLPL